MTADTWAIIATVLVTNIGLFAWLRGDLAKLSGRIDSLYGRVDPLSERMARMEGR